MNEAHCDIALAYLRVLLSAPPITALVVFVLVCIFKSDLRKIMSRIAKISFPGGEIETTSQKDPPPEPGPDQVPQGATGQETQTDLPEGLTLSPQEQDLLKDYIHSLRTMSAFWEFRYLNLFFVPNTQLVLNWLSTLEIRPALEVFHAAWSRSIPRAEHRNSILAALQEHGLIVTPATMLEITDKGRAYLQWRGPFPAPQ